MSQSMTHRLSVYICKLLGRSPIVLRSLEGTWSLIALDNRHCCSPLHVKISIFEAILVQNLFFQKLFGEMHESVLECVKHIYKSSNLNFYVSKHIIDVRNGALVDTVKFKKSHFWLENPFTFPY